MQVVFHAVYRITRCTVSFLVDRRGELLKERFIVLLRGALLHDNGAIIIGDFVNHEGRLVSSFFIEELLERRDAFIRNINIIVDEINLGS